MQKHASRQDIDEYLYDKRMRTVSSNQYWAKHTNAHMIII